MSFSRTFINLLAFLLKRRRKVPPGTAKMTYILVIRRNRMGDMIYTLPLLHALRRHFPQAHLTVACDPAGAPIAEACDGVNEVIVLKSGWSLWPPILTNARRLQGFDWTIAAKGGFDRRLALLSRLTNASLRLGFERARKRPSLYYTESVVLPPEAKEEHQVDTLLRLLRPLGLVRTTAFTVDLSLTVPPASRDFAANVLSSAPFVRGRKYMLINLSSTVHLKFREEDFITLAGRILGATDYIIGFVAAPLDQQKAHEIANCLGSNRVAAVETPGPLDLAAMIESASLLLTPEGGAAHLAAAVDTPAVVLWSEGPFKKWYSRGRRHVFVHAEGREKNIPVERAWQALQPLLIQKNNDLEKKWADLLEMPSSDSIS
jgi:ADP-heptose:LPS heptosyltransferase